MEDGPHDILDTPRPRPILLRVIAITCPVCGHKMETAPDERELTCEDCFSELVILSHSPLRVEVLEDESVGSYE